MSGAEIVVLELHLHRERARAVLVSDDGEEAGACWLPLSEIEIEVLRGRRVSVTMPAWLADDRGLSGAERVDDVTDLFGAGS